MFKAGCLYSVLQIRFIDQTIIGALVQILNTDYYSFSTTKDCCNFRSTTYFKNSSIIKQKQVQMTNKCSYHFCDL